MSTSDFRANEFRTYEVKVKGLSLGFIDTGGGGYSPDLGETLEYDGTTVVLSDGRTFQNVPQLRSAIPQWIAPVGTQTTTSRPKSAGIKVRPTETKGTERVERTVIATEMSEDREVGSIKDRKARREATNIQAAKNVPLETREARKAMAASQSSSLGDEELDLLVSELDKELKEYRVKNFGEDPEAAKEDNDEDILSMLNSVEEKASPKVSTKSARNLPVDMQDDRKTMPIVKEDLSESAGTVVGSVQDQQRTVLERAEEISIDVAQAKPPAPKKEARARFGNTGAIIVDEQRDMGQISLSSTSAPVRLDETAKVSSSSQEVIKMDAGAQVGRKTASSRPVTSVEGGVAVGRILSPTKQSFVATDANTSSTAIERTAGGKRLRVETFASSEDTPVAKATGDVEEATAGDTLEEILPNAAKGPKPEVHLRPEDDPAYKAVRMLIPDFEWNKDLPVKTRVANALKHVENPQYVKGILAVETKVAQEEIKKALAKEIKRRSKAGKEGAKKAKSSPKKAKKAAKTED